MGRPNRGYAIGETGKVRWEVLRYCTGKGLDLGCGADKIHTQAVGIDWVSNCAWNGRPFANNLAADLSKPLDFRDGTQEFVYSSHCLEDMEQPEKVLRDWWRVVKPGGHLVLYLPHPDLYRAFVADDPNGENVAHKRDLYPDEVKGWMAKWKGWDCLRDEIRGEGDEYSFLLVYRKRKDKKTVELPKRPDPAKSVCVVRYGGAGDHVMTQTIFPVLKQHYEHLTVITNPVGEECLRANPYVDEIWSDTAALNDPQLHEYLDHHRRSGRFARTINMMDSVENITLPQPSQRIYHCSRTLREAVHSLNYYQTTFAQAELPIQEPPGATWYATTDERAWAARERGRAPFVVVLALAGSAVHKVSPWWPQVVSGLLADEAVTVVTVGSQKDTMLYTDFPEHPRHLRRAGVWGMRQAYAFAQLADVVVGPETGLLNAVGEALAPAKVLLLSHSSEDQICRYWKRYTAITQDEEEGCPEQPCHRLHWDWTYCRRDEATGGAKCAAAISPERIVDAVLAYRHEAKEEAA